MPTKGINMLSFAVIALLGIGRCIIGVTGFDQNLMNVLLNGETLTQDYADKFTRVYIKYNFNTPTCTQLNEGRRILSPANSTAVRSNILNSVAGDLISDLNPNSVPIISHSGDLLIIQDEDSDLEMDFRYSHKFNLDSLIINRPIPTDLESPVPLQKVIEKLNKLPCVDAVGLEPRVHAISSKPSENVRAASKVAKETKTPAGTVPGLKEPVYTYPNDPYHNQQWWYLSKGEAKQHYPAFGADFVLPNLQEVHQIWNGNDSNYKIGVVDTGLDIFHPDILVDGKVNSFFEFSGTDPQFYFNRAEANGYHLDSENLDACFDGIDTDNNGFTDDCIGISFIGWPYPLDFAGHGTHVSGLIAAKTDNKKHVASSCPHCKIVPMAPLFPVEALIYAIITNVPLMNWSFGFYRDDLYCTDGGAFCNAVEEYFLLLESLIQAYKDEVDGVIVVAAGNEPTDLDDCLGLTPNDPLVCRLSGFFYGYPCQLSVKYDNIICVGASDHFGKVAKFSTFGKESVTIFAPGVDMLSLGVTYFAETQANYQGTSMAAPVVSGIVGLIRSRYPSLTVAQINKIMKVSCQKTKQLQTKSVCGGVIDAVKAMAHASVCNQAPSQCGMPLSPGADEESHESVLSWFCQKAASFGHSYVPFCQT